MALPNPYNLTGVKIGDLIINCHSLTRDLTIGKRYKVFDVKKEVIPEEVWFRDDRGNLRKAINGKFKKL